MHEVGATATKAAERISDEYDRLDNPLGGAAEHAAE
jgi:hypothetical protein